MTDLPDLACFRLRVTEAGIAHLVFDLPGRSMNVLTNAAIHELGRFAAWLRGSDVAGVVVSSAKGAFCAGADLTELGVAYDMIMAAPKAERSRLAFDHFFPLSRALRALETAGKPIAAAISGLALGGGFELALGCHRRIVADAPRTALGLPESLVGLLPGGGGTQRLPRLVGVAAALPILLEGARLSPEAALEAGAADEVVPAGEEVAAAERWVRGRPEPRQPWDRPGGRSSEESARASLASARDRVMRDTNGHYPAPLAILDCLERGGSLPMDEAIVVEMEIFAQLIQRPEPRNMIRTLFIAKGEHDRLREAGGLPAGIAAAVDAARGALAAHAAAHDPDAIATARAIAGFTGPPPDMAAPSATTAGPPAADAGDGEDSAGLWFDRADLSTAERIALGHLLAAAAAVGPHRAKLDEREVRLADYAALAELGFPAYLGGPFALGRYLGREGLDRLSARAEGHEKRR